jgi:CRP-like cAMP-binding protein
LKEDFIQYAPLFAGLQPAEQAILNEHFTAGQANAGAVLFQVGAKADGLYLVGKGFVRLFTAGGSNLATLGPGSILGEDSLYRGVPYDVSAHAVAELEFWKLSDGDLRTIIVQNPVIGLKLSQNFGSLIAQMQEYLVQQLGKTPELTGLPRHTLQSVADLLQPRRLAAGQYLYRAGEPPSGLFLVESGRIDVHGDNEEDRQTLSAGRLLGALSMLTNKPQTTSAVAVDDGVLWVLSAGDFQSLSSRQPGLRRSLGRNVSARLSRADQSQAVLRLLQMPFFAALPPQVVQAIAQRMVLQHVPAGERVYRVGEAGDAFYLVESGEIELTAENAYGVVEEMARIGPEGAFGDMSLLTGQVRTEDATATRNTNLWLLFKGDLDTLAAKYPAIGTALSQAVAARLAAGTGAEVALRQFTLFADLSAADLRQVAAVLHPMRYRAGEVIFRAGAPGDTLYLIEKGQVRVQSVGGGMWALGPGEEFGERALLTEQPHNTTTTAETEVDLWTLSKADFDTLMNRFPSVAISMSRLLSQRLTPTVAAPPPSLPGGPPYSAPPVGMAPAASPSSRRRQQAAAAGEVEPQARRQGFGEWYGNLSGWGKLRFALLILLLVLLLCCTVPFTIMAIINGPAAATRAAVSTLSGAISAVYAQGSYEVASADTGLVERMRQADALVPPTPTYTPFPTNTPLPTPTPLPTNTPLPTATFTPEPVYDASVFAAAAPVEQPTETPTAAPQAPAAPPRNLDTRIPQLGVSIEDAQVAPGQPYWRLIEGRWEDEQQAGGKHHIYVDVLDESGKRIVGQPVTVFWGDGQSTAALEDKPAPDLGFNYQMYASGYAYNVKVEGLPSDIVRGAGMGDLANRFKGIHVAYYFIFQKAIKQ